MKCKFCKQNIMSAAKAACYKELALACAEQLETTIETLDKLSLGTSSRFPIRSVSRDLNKFRSTLVQVLNNVTDDKD